MQLACPSLSVHSGGVDNSSQVDIFVWSVRHGEQTRAIGKGRHPLRSVETDLQQTGAHLKTWSFAGHGAHAGQCFAERSVFVAEG
jgi:hypothetical protein